MHAYPSRSNEESGESSIFMQQTILILIEEKEMNLFYDSVDSVV